MQAASNEYKEMMRRKWRNPLSYVRVTIGVINQEAQASMYVPEPEQYTYYSDLKKPMDNYQVKELYATCDQNYTVVDGSMYFLPRAAPDVVLNQGIVSEELFGSIQFAFPVAYDVRGLTIEFGAAYPVDFTIESDNKMVQITGNTEAHFVTDEIFEGATFLRLTPSTMVNGQSRFRIHQITMGIGIYFGNREILSATKKEHISPISEELPTVDFELSVVNRDRAFDVENKESTINYLEVGQDVEVLYGQGLDDGSIEWIPGVFLTLKEWSADDTEMDFRASDRFEAMNNTFYGGDYYPEGVSLYDLALEVFQDAEVDSRTYWIDPYLKGVKVSNPMPAVTHKEALQLIANAGRCILYQDRSQKIILKSSFLPDMEASSENETYFSNAAAILDGDEKDGYALTGEDHTAANGTVYFLPRESSGTLFLNTGYVSEQVADGEGDFEENPTVEVGMEAAFKCFGLTLEFGDCWPETVVFHAYYNGELQEDYAVEGLSQNQVINHEFPEMDRLILEFTKGCPNNRVILKNIFFGDNTDYVLEYGVELTKTPKGTQLDKVKELQIIRTLYNYSSEDAMELLRETITVTAEENRHTFYFTSAAYGFSASITGAENGQAISIISSSAYYATVELTGVTGSVEVVITGKEYVITQAKTSRALNTTGGVEIWENPLVSENGMAADLSEWIGDYLKADREYDLSYHGEPRLDANDLVFLENKYVPDLLVRIYDHTLKFNGGLSGTIKARRDMSNVAAAKNRLASR